MYIFNQERKKDKVIKMACMVQNINSYICVLHITIYWWGKVIWN